MPDRFAACELRSLERAVLARFAEAVWGAGTDLGKRWWMRSSHADVEALADRDSGELAAICVAVPSIWVLPAGEVAVRSICGWYVAPAYRGLRLGQRLVEAIQARTPHLNTFSISDAAIRSFRQMGWTGPHRSRLRLLPLPAWRKVPTGNLRVRTVEVTGDALPAGLAADLDRIDRLSTAACRRRRKARDWAAHLAVHPARRHRFHLVERDGVAVGYAVSRAADAEAGRRYRLARTHYLTDMAFDAFAASELSAVLALVAASVPKRAAFLLMCTTDDALADAAAQAGWLHEHTPLIGPRLRAKAPQYMLGGAFTAYDGEPLALTFCDSDIDLNI